MQASIQSFPLNSREHDASWVVISHGGCGKVPQRRFGILLLLLLQPLSKARLALRFNPCFNFWIRNFNIVIVHGSELGKPLMGSPTVECAFKLRLKEERIQ